MKSIYSKIALITVIALIFIGAAGSVFANHRNHERIEHNESRISRNSQALCMLAVADHNSQIYKYLNCGIILKPHG